MTVTDWFARPIVNVRDVEASLRFYVERLGFTCPWRFDEDGKAYVAQVDRQGCALILAKTWPEKAGKALMFISLNVERASPQEEASPEAATATPGAQVAATATSAQVAATASSVQVAATAALDALRAELEAKGVAVKDGKWGYRLLVVDDPDGNQLLFNYPK